MTTSPQQSNEESFTRGVINDIVADIRSKGLALLLIILTLLTFVNIASIVYPPKKPKYWTIQYDKGVYTTDTLSFTPTGCVTIPRYTLCGDVIISEHEGKLPDESFK